MNLLFIFSLFSIVTSSNIKFPEDNDMKINKVSPLTDENPVEEHLTDDVSLIAKKIINLNNECILSLEYQTENEGFLRIGQTEEEYKYHYVASNQPLIIMSRLINQVNEEIDQEFKPLCENEEDEIFVGKEEILEALNQLEWNSELLQKFTEHVKFSKFFDVTPKNKNFWEQNRKVIFGNKDIMNSLSSSVVELETDIEDIDDHVKTHINTIFQPIFKLIEDLKVKIKEADKDEDDTSFEAINGVQEQVEELFNEIKSHLISTSSESGYLENRKNVIKHFKTEFEAIFSNDLLYFFGIWKKNIDNKAYYGYTSYIKQIIEHVQFGKLKNEISDDRVIKMISAFTMYLMNDLFVSFNLKYRDSKCSKFLKEKYDLLKNIKTETLDNIALINDKDSVAEIKKVFDENLESHIFQDPTVHEYKKLISNMTNEYWLKISQEKKTEILPLLKSLWLVEGQHTNLMNILSAGEPMDDQETSKFEMLLLDEERIRLV